MLLQDCVQMHGGIGLTFEHDLHLFLRRHTLDRTLLGTPADHRPTRHRVRRDGGGTRERRFADDAGRVP